MEEVVADMECLEGQWDLWGEIGAMIMQDMILAMIMPAIADTRIREIIGTMDMITDAATVMTIMAAIQ